MVESEIAGAPKISPLLVGTVSDAYRAGATSFLHVYFTKRAGSLRFEMETEDASRHKMVAVAAVDGSLLPALNAVAKKLAPAARPFSSSNADAVAAWGRGEYERAIGIDPDFGAAWLSWIEMLAARGDTAGAIDVAGRALARGTLRSEIDRARIEEASAALRKDTEAQEKALAALERLLPADTSLIETLARIEFGARRFSAAAEQYRKLLAVDPANASAMNSLAYAEAYAGNFDAARKAIDEYGRQPGQKPNSLDSMGEIYFLQGRFKDAEKYFLEAQQADASLLSGADLLKAAYAHWLSGDLPGADLIAARYIEFRRNLRDPLLPWREATWQYATGRSAEAMAKLGRLAPNQKELAGRQTAVWRGEASLPTDLTALKEMYDRTAPSADGLVRTFYAAALLAAGRKDEARRMLALWPLPESGDALFQSLMYPKFLALRRAAGL